MVASLSYYAQYRVQPFSPNSLAHINLRKSTTKSIQQNVAGSNLVSIYFAYDKQLPATMKNILLITPQPTYRSWSNPAENES